VDQRHARGSPEADPARRGDHSGGVPAVRNQARKEELKIGAANWNESNEFREFQDAGKVWRFPNLHFPPPGLPLAALKKGVLLTLGRHDRLDESRKAIPMLPQIRQVVELIEWVKPVRIVSIHGNHSAVRSGIFVDSRYAVCVKDGFALENCKFDLAKDPAYPEVTREGWPSSSTRPGPSRAATMTSWPGGSRTPWR